MDKQAVAELTEAEVQEWRAYPATKAFLVDLRSRVREGQQDWAAEAYQRETATQTAVANAKALGGIQVLQALIQFLEG